MAGWSVQIIRSFFALPLWVLIWICLFLVPANFAGLWFLDTVTGRWVAVLGAGAILINIVIVFINGGFSKVMALPHLAFWVPLQIILGVRLLSAPMDTAEFALAMVVFVINGISLFFDVYDTIQWWKGERAITGFPDAPVRL